jgi:hypothetical protein
VSATALGADVFVYFLVALFWVLAVAVAYWVIRLAVRDGLADQQQAVTTRHDLGTRKPGTV